MCPMFFQELNDKDLEWTLLSLMELNDYIFFLLFMSPNRTGFAESLRNKATGRPIVANVGQGH